MHFYINMGHKAPQAARKIREVEVHYIFSNGRAQNWLKNFKGGDLSFEMKNGIITS